MWNLQNNLFSRPIRTTIMSTKLKCFWDINYLLSKINVVGQITGSSNNLAPFSSTSMKEDRVSRITWSIAWSGQRLKYFSNSFLFFGHSWQALKYLFFLESLANFEATGFAAKFNIFFQSLSQIKHNFSWSFSGWLCYRRKINFHRPETQSDVSEVRIFPGEMRTGD